MLHVTCDCCGKRLGQEEQHHILKIEVFEAREAPELTEEDLDADHLEAVAQLIRDAEDSDEPVEVEPRSSRLRYDLCCSCRTRYLRDPLGREHTQKFHFSEN